MWDLTLIGYMWPHVLFGTTCINLELHNKYEAISHECAVGSIGELRMFFTAGFYVQVV